MSKNKNIWRKDVQTYGQLFPGKSCPGKCCLGAVCLHLSGINWQHSTCLGSANVNQRTSNYLTKAWQELANKIFANFAVCSVCSAAVL